MNDNQGTKYIRDCMVNGREKLYPKFQQSILNSSQENNIPSILEGRTDWQTFEI